MLPPFIIEQIRRREEAERARRDQPQLDLPLDTYRPAPPSEVPDPTELPQRGVVILDLLGNG